MTEFGPGLFALSPEMRSPQGGQHGRPNFSWTSAWWTTTTRPAPAPNQVGELVLKAPSLGSGYFN